jgi:hypothetical protein
MMSGANTRSNFATYTCSTPLSFRNILATHHLESIEHYVSPPSDNAPKTIYTLLTYMAYACSFTNKQAASLAFVELKCQRLQICRVKVSHRLAQPAFCRDTIQNPDLVAMYPR